MMRLDFEKQNGLIPCIVQDVDTKKVLMLAYMNEESYKKTIETKLATYYSRSRQSLWSKAKQVDIINMYRQFASIAIKIQFY